MKRISILALIIITMLTIGCSNKNKESIDNNGMYTEEVEKDEEIIEENYTVFNCLDNVYEKNQDITLYEKGEEVFNNLTNNIYETGKYMEVYYANDFIEKYLSGDQSVYNYLITLDDKYDVGYKEANNDEKDRLKESLQFLREQMYLNNEDPIYFRLSKVSYDGQVEGIKDSVILNMTGYISGDNINFLSLSKFTITIVQDKDKLLVNII